VFIDGTILRVTKLTWYEERLLRNVTVVITTFLSQVFKIQYFYSTHYYLLSVVITDLELARVAIPQTGAILKDKLTF